MRLMVGGKCFQAGQTVCVIDQEIQMKEHERGSMRVLRDPGEYSICVSDICQRKTRMQNRRHEHGLGTIVRAL